MFFNLFPETQYKIGKQSVNISDISRYANVDNILKDEVSLYQFYEISDGDRPDVVSTKLYGNPDYHWTFFLINDRLKNGMNEWPLSYNQLQLYLDIEDYKKFGLQFDSSIAGINYIKPNSIIYNRSGPDVPTAKIIEVNTQFRQLIVQGNISDFSVGDTISGSNNDPETYSEITKVTSFRGAIHHYEDSSGKYGYNPLWFNLPTEPPREVTWAEYLENKNTERRMINVVRPNLIHKFMVKFREKINA